MKIGAVAEQSGFTTSTIRYYEEIGLLPAPKRISGRRDYDAHIFTYLRVIKLAQSTGFSLNEIQQLFVNNEASALVGEAFVDDWRTVAQKKLTEIDQLIAQYQEMRTLIQTGLDCDCLTCATCEWYAEQTK